MSGKSRAAIAARERARRIRPVVEVIEEAPKPKKSTTTKTSTSGLGSVTTASLPKASS